MPKQMSLHPTKKQAEVLSLVTHRIEVDGYAPTLAELATSLGVSRVSIKGRIDGLIQRGYLTREPFIARGLMLTNKQSPRKCPHCKRRIR